MTTNNDDDRLFEDLTEPFGKFLNGLDHHNPKERLFLACGLVELLRHTRSATDLFSMMSLLETVQYIDWARIPFSLTKTLLSDKYHNMVRKAGVPEDLIPEVLQTALVLFVDKMWAMTPAAPTEAMLQEVVEAVAASTVETIKPEPEANPKLPVVSPEIFNARLVRRVFEPEAFTADVAAALRLDVVTYRGVLPNKSCGPMVRGVAFQNDQHYSVLLETGEYLEVPLDYEHIVVSSAPEDFKHLHVSLLLALTAAAEPLEAFALIDPDQSAILKGGKLGKFLKPHFLGVADADDFRPLEHVFDIGREAGSIGVTGATSPTGAIVRFPVPATDMVVVIEAQQDSLGPYSMARLVKTTPDEKDVVLMRLETPRHYSLRGVYLFPLPDCLVSLTSIY